MSVRSNSLRAVIIDSAYIGCLMGLAAAAMTALAFGAERDGARQAESPRLAVDHIDSQRNTDDNLPSGSQVESPADKRQARMLGMDLRQRQVGDIRVKDVAATSPAWDAGIRPGDRVLSIDGLKPNELSPWVQDLAQVLRETSDGQAVAVNIDRDGEQLELRVRLPISRAAEVRDARQEERALATMSAGQNGALMQAGQAGMPAGQTGAQVVPGATQTAGYNQGYGGYGLAGWGVDAGFFGDTGGTMGEDRTATNAYAELIAMNTVGGNTAAGGINRNNQLNSNATTSGANMGGAAGTSGQVGLAVFHDNGESINAIVSVRGLPQGTYLVGISQSDVLGSFGAGFNGGSENGAVGQNARDQRAGTTSGRLNTNRLRNRQVPPNQNAPNPPGGGTRVVPFGSGNGNAVPANGAAPGGTMNPAGARPAGGVSPAGGSGAQGNGASLANPNALATLAQQLDPNQSSDIGQQNFNPPQTSVQREAAQSQAITDRARTNTSRTSLDDNNDSRLPNDFTADPNQDAGGMPPMLAQIGTLQIGPDGGGRIENQLDGVTVRNLEGLTVIVVDSRQQRGFARNPNDVNPQRNGAFNNSDLPRNNAAVRGNSQNAFGNANTGRGNQTVGPSIVARGDIQLISGGVGLPGLGSGQNQSQTQQQQQPVDDAKRIERSQNPISNPRQGF
jgi:PDZ domain